MKQNGHRVGGRLYFRADRRVAGRGQPFKQ
jgi:hypothetical protein